MKRATYEDVSTAPENKVAEIVDGELVLSPRPTARHSATHARLLRRVGGPFEDGLDGPGGWWILIEPELRIGENVLVPDIAGWRRERMPSVPDVPFFTLVPDWVCEVLSPASEQVERGKKLRIYAEAGVAHAWVVNPVERTLEVLRLRDGAWTIVAVHTGGDVVRAEPFDAVELELGTLWIESEGQARPPQTRRQDG